MKKMNEVHCLGKDAFSSPAAARRVMKRTGARNRLNIYRCPECGKFHIGGSMSRGHVKQ